MSGLTVRREPYVGYRRSPMKLKEYLGRPEPTRSQILPELYRALAALIAGRPRAAESAALPARPVGPAPFKFISEWWEPEVVTQAVFTLTTKIICLLDVLRRKDHPNRAVAVEDLVRHLINQCALFNLDALYAALKAYKLENEQADDHTEELVVIAAQQAVIELQREHLILMLREHPAHGLPCPLGEPSADEWYYNTLLSNIAPPFIFNVRRG